MNENEFQTKLAELFIIVNIDVLDELNVRVGDVPVLLALAHVRVEVVLSIPHLNEVVLVVPD